MIQGNTAIRTETGPQTASTCSPNSYTVRCKDFKNTTLCSFAPVTGMDGIIGSQFYQLVDLNPLLSLPVIPERIFINGNTFRSRIAVLKGENGGVLSELSGPELPKKIPETEVGKLANPALPAMINDGELVHLRHPTPLLHHDICKDMQLCNPPVLAAWYELCWEVDGLPYVHGVVRGRAQAPPGSSVRIGNLILDALWSGNFEWHEGLKRKMLKGEVKGECVLGDVLQYLEKTLAKRAVLVSDGMKHSRIVLEDVAVASEREKAKLGTRHWTFGLRDFKRLVWFSEVREPGETDAASQEAD